MNSSDAGDGKTEDALLIIAAVLCLMIGMVILRFCTNLLIDCCILNDQERARSDLIRTLCPWYHRRTQPTSESSSNDDEAQTTVHSVEAVPYGIRKERLINRLSLFHLSAETLKECKVKDHREHSQRTDGKVLHDREEEIAGEHDENATHKKSSVMMCSICLHELIPGENVFSTPYCQHLFHPKCMCEWMTAVTNSNNNECPNCRREIIAKAELNRILLDEQTGPENV